jgi:hypothetical protein
MLAENPTETETISNLNGASASAWLFGGASFACLLSWHLEFGFGFGV